MSDADHGTGALYELMDTIRQKIRESKKKQEREELENAYDEKGMIL